MRTTADPSRRELADALGLESGPASDLVKRLREARLVSERRAAAQGPGRPTSSVHAHPDGPVAIAIDLRHSDWRLGICATDGDAQVLVHGQHDGNDPHAVLDEIRQHVRRVARRLGRRVVGVGVAVPGQTDGQTLLHAALLGWRDVELSRLSPTSRVPLVAGNDASMSAMAEARLHRPAACALLHVVAEVGVNGALVTGGRPITGAHGLHGEFGHLPFGDPSLLCPCGARGCWTVAFETRQIARRLGRRTPRDQRAWLSRLFTDPRATPAEAELRAELGADLGRGIAGIVNALDPDVVTLGGLANGLRESARADFDAAFSAGLMMLHRERRPAIEAARAGDDAALVGAGLIALDRVLDAEFLAGWAAESAVAR